MRRLQGAYRGAGAQTANILNFNVGPTVELTLSPTYFSRVRNLFGGKKVGANFRALSNRMQGHTQAALPIPCQFVQGQGADRAIEAAVDAIAVCLRSDGCTDIPDEFKDLANGKEL